jgi:hypothetical protein
MPRLFNIAHIHFPNSGTVHNCSFCQRGYVIHLTEGCDSGHRAPCMQNRRIVDIVEMTRVRRFVAVMVSTAAFAMPAATLPLHCVLMAPMEKSSHQQCLMVGMNSSAEQIKAGDANHSCCAVSAAKPELIAVPPAPADHGMFAPQASAAFLSDLPAAPIHELLAWNVQSPVGPPQAFLCTFLI